MALSTFAKEQENFLRYAILIVDHSKEALQDLIELNLRNKHLTFEEFLNQNQHEIYHLCYNSKCCQCHNSSPKGKRVIYPSQLVLLFDKHNKLSCHTATNCTDFCCSKSRVGITTEVLDISLARCLLVNCCLDVFWFTILTAQGQTLEQFLNLNKHVIYHLWKNYEKCCQCPAGFILPRDYPIITENEWRGMFSSVLLPCINDRRRISTGTTSVCSVAARPGIDVKDIHPEIQGLILKWCCSVRKSVEKLIEFRNINFGHVTNAKLSDSNFKDFSKKTEECILNIASFCEKEQKVKEVITNLHSRPIDARLCSHYQNILLENINRNEAINENTNLQHRTTRQSIPRLVDKSCKIRKMEKRIDALETSNTKIKEDIQDIYKLVKEGPKRQRLIDQTSAEIESHKKEDTYLETEAVRQCIQLLESRNVVIISGREGSGKSRNALEILRQLKEKNRDFDVFKLIGLHYVSDIVKCNVTSIVLFDDAFDKTSELFSYDEQVLDHLLSYITKNKVKLIFTIRKAVRHACQMLLSTHKLFHDLVDIDLNSEKFKLTEVEKEKMLTNYCVTNKIMISEEDEANTDQSVSNEAKRDDNEAVHSVPDQSAVILKRKTMNEIIKTDPFVGFPKCCRLFTENRKKTTLDVSCFKWPSAVLVNDIEKLRMEGIHNYCNGLKYVILIHILTLTYSHEKGLKRIIDVQDCKQIFNICYHMNKEVRTSDIEHVCEGLTGRYLVYTDRTYYFQHRAIMDSVLISYSKINSKDIIPLLHFDHMEDLLRPHNYIEQDGEIVIKIPKLYYPELAKKIITYYDSNSYRRLLESKIFMENDIDLIYQLILYIHNTKDSLPSSFISSTISNYFPLCLLRCIGKLDDKLTVNHTKENEMLISVIFGDKNITFSVDPWESLYWAFYNEYRDIIKWLFQNTDHSLFDEGFPCEYDSDMYSHLEFAQIIVENIENNRTNMNSLLYTVISGKCIRTLDWILDNVDNSLMDFDIIINLLDSCYDIGDDSDIIGDKLLLILKKVNHKLFNIYNILHFAIDVLKLMYENHNCLDNEKTSRFVDVTNRRIWHGVLEALLNDDSDSSIDINKTIKDAFEQLNDHGNGNEDNDENEDEKYMKEIILLIMKKYPNNIDVRNSIMDTACQIGCHEIVEEGLSNKNDKITYYLNFTLDILQYQSLNSWSIPFYRDHGKILLLLLPMVNLNLIDLDSLMHDICRIGHSLAALWLLENKPSYPFDIRSVINKACYQGDLKFVEYLLLKYNGEDFDYRTAMIKACRNSNGNTLDLCKWLWENNDRCLFDMKASLNNASRCDNTEVVEWILTEVDKGLLDTEAAFLLACEHGEYDTVELLLDASSINMLDIQSAIIIACRNEDNDLSITELLYNSADQSTININAVFSAACKNYRSDIVQWIIETCDQNITVTKTKDGNKHFIKSLDKNRVDMDQAVTCILDMDAHEQKEDHVNETKIQLLRLILNKIDPSIIHIYKLLTEACKNDWIEVFQWILGSVDHACLNIGEIINVACQNGAFNIIKWSLETIDMQLVDADNVMVESCGFGWLECLVLIWKRCNQYKLQAAMTEACIYGRLHIAEWLVQNVHYQRFNIPMLLQEAGRNGWIYIFGWLLKNFHFEKSDMHIATSQALENGHLKIAELVISTVGKECFSFSSLSDNAYVGANKEGVVNFLLHNTDHRSIDIATIMTNACLFGWKDIATFIVDNDLSSLCDLSLAFNAACDNGELEIAQLLLEKVGPRILTTVDKAMHSVAVKGWDEIALLLLDKVEHTRLDIGNTLIEACRHGEIDIVQAILRKVERTMLDVKTALYKACENHMHEELVLLILENIDQEQVDLKTVKIQAIRHKWREVQFALTKVDTEDLKQFEEEDATDNIIFLE